MTCREYIIKYVFLEQVMAAAEPFGFQLEQKDFYGLNNMGKIAALDDKGAAIFDRRYKLTHNFHNFCINIIDKSSKLHYTIVYVNIGAINNDEEEKQ